MELTLLRFASKSDFTLGALYAGGFECFTVEDEFRTKKVKGETRFQDGRFRILLRTEGGMHLDYLKKFPFHRGMLWLQDVPNFEFVYIHIGNSDDDTEGCVLVGTSAQSNGTVASSRLAYVELYTKVLTAMDKGEEVWITVRTAEEAKLVA